MMGGDGRWESTCKTQECLSIQTIVEDDALIFVLEYGYFVES